MFLIHRISREYLIRNIDKEKETVFIKKVVYKYFVSFIRINKSNSWFTIYFYASFSFFDEVNGSLKKWNWVVFLF